MYRIKMPAGKFAQGLATDQFKNDFIALCQRHRSERRALIFAAIVYSYKDAQVHKALEDPDYWNALNEISGHNATVFVFYAPVDDPQAPEDFWEQSETNLARKGLAEISKCFLRGKPFTLPAMLFFQVEQQSVIDGVAVTLRSDRAEDSFVEMKNVLLTVNSALHQVKENNRGNAGPIFSLVRKALAERSLGLKLRDWGKTAVDAARLAKVFGGIVGG